MIVQPKFSGLWMCPDAVTPLNNQPPFEYKCNGMELTGRAANEFLHALHMEFERNQKN